MTHNIRPLLDVAGISIPPIGTYVLPDPAAFEPFESPSQCIFGHFGGWLKGRSTVIDAANAGAYACPGAGYWLCGIETVPRKDVANYLAEQEGLKRSSDLMCEWLESCPPARIDGNAVVISRLRDDHHEFLKTVTFYVTPDQMSFLLTGAEYRNASAEVRPVMSPYGSGCGQLLTMFPDLSEARAMIGATDIAMRKYLPPNLLAFTVTRPMFDQLCRLDENSFSHKTFWKELQEARKMSPGRP